MLNPPESPADSKEEEVQVVIMTTFQKNLITDLERARKANQGEKVVLEDLSLPFILYAEFAPQQPSPKGSDPKCNILLVRGKTVEDLQIFIRNNSLRRDPRLAYLIIFGQDRKVIEKLTKDKS